MTELILAAPFIILAVCIIYLEREVEKLKHFINNQYKESLVMTQEMNRVLDALKVELEKQDLNKGGVWPAIKE